MAKVIASTYEILEKIASHGDSHHVVDVYLAMHKRLGIKVIVKAEKRKERKMTVRSEQVRREVDVLKQLRHAYIPQVYDFFQEDDESGIVYTVMTYIEGESLDKPLARGEKFSQPQVIQWAKQLLEALSYLHSPTHGDPPKGYVHSDIKPANIMRTPTGGICLIDFNITLALGEENVVGRTPGYASPEHYGLDFSSSALETVPVESDTTKPLSDSDETRTMVSPSSKSISSLKRIVPDVRSDIYSLGATLYHLLSGKRPSINARDVTPLSEKDFSPQIVEIISKAMAPNPDMRYQTADEMLLALKALHENDIRTKRQRRRNITAAAVLVAFLLVGLAETFVGLKRMQTTESWLKLAEYAETAVADGDMISALDYAVQALPEDRNILTPSYTSEAKKALADALGVYDLSDGFKKYKTVELPANPLYMVISPNGKTGVCMYAGHIALFDTESAEVFDTLSADESALSEVEFRNDNTILYAGDKGLCCYDIAGKTTLWTGKPATAIAISGDAKTVAAIYKDESVATIYDTQTGDVKREIDFQGKFQSVMVNDTFANPKDNLLALNDDGTMLGVSFADGSLAVYDLSDSGDVFEILNDSSGYTHFEGGFYEQYFAYSAASPSGSIFHIVDMEEKVQTGGFSSDSSFGVAVDARGIYVQTENLLVKIDPVSGEQIPLVTTPEALFRFAISDPYTLVTSKDSVMFFDAGANLMTSLEAEWSGDFVQLANGTALLGSIDSPKIKILKYENHGEAEIFSYDPAVVHDEARISADGETVMLFSYDSFSVYDIDGTLLKQADIPEQEDVYDQQFVRDGTESYLEVTYNDGTLLTYNARDGSLLSEEETAAPDGTLYEEFSTDDYRIESPLHGSPTVYDKATNRVVCTLQEEGYLTYITQAGEYIIAQYVTAENNRYAVLLDENCAEIAHLPNLCDVWNSRLYFDYPTGDIRVSSIYETEELLEMAREELKGGRTDVDI